MRPLLVVLAMVSGTLHGAPSDAGLIAPEYAIKAVFLYNLAKYAEWPQTSPLSDPAKPIVIAVFGEDPFGKSLDEAARDRPVRGRPVLILRTADLKALGSAHIVFISPSEAARAGEAVRILSAASALAVGDTDSTARAGAAVNFVMVQGKIRFDINRSTARRSQVELSSQLLKLARHIEAEN